MMGTPSDVLPHVHAEEQVQGDSPTLAGDQQSHSPTIKNEIKVGAQ